MDEDNSLCPDWRMVHLGDVALLEKPADNRSPKRIDCYQVVERSADGAAFKLDLALIQPGAEHWVNTANLTLLGALRRRPPDAIDWGPLFASSAVQMLDHFEAAQESSPVRH